MIIVLIMRELKINYYLVLTTCNIERPLIHPCLKDDAVLPYN
jgi:hypothetical protein